MATLKIESTKGTVLLNLSHVIGALRTRDNGIDIIALSTTDNGSPIICFAHDVSKISEEHKHVIELGFPAGDDELDRIMRVIEHNM